MTKLPKALKSSLEEIKKESNKKGYIILENVKEGRHQLKYGLYAIIPKSKVQIKELKLFLSGIPMSTYNEYPEEIDAIIKKK